MHLHCSSAPASTALGIGVQPCSIVCLAAGGAVPPGAAGLRPAAFLGGSTPYLHSHECNRVWAQLLPFQMPSMGLMAPFYLFQRFEN